MMLDLVRQRPWAAAAALCTAVLLYECSGPDVPGRHNAIAQIIDQSRTPLDRFEDIRGAYIDGMAAGDSHYRARIRITRTWTMSSSDILHATPAGASADGDFIRRYIARVPPFAAGERETTECDYDFIRTESGWRYQPIIC